MRAFGWLFLVAASTLSARPPQDGATRWHTIAEADAAATKQLTLVYFGAEWCPPCKMLETGVFNQPDIEAAVAPFRAVYIDGDAPDAQALMERFSVMVYPSLIAIGAHGTEVGRLVGSAEKLEVQRFLETSTHPEGPLALLARVAEGDALSAEQWAVLSEIEVSEAAALNYAGEAGAKELETWQRQMTRAIAALDRLPTTLPPAADARLRMKALVVASIGPKPAADRARHQSALERVLADAALLAATEQEVAGYAEEILTYLQPDANAGKRALARKLLVAMDTAYSRAQASASWKMELLGYALKLLPFGSDDIDADKTRFAERVESVLKQTTGTKERLAIAQPAARVLKRTGRELRGEAVLRETLAMAPDAWWLLDTLAGYAELRGDGSAAAQLAEQSYRASLAHTSGLGRGSLWIGILTRNLPRDAGRIRAAAVEVLDIAMKTPDPFRGWTADSMTSLATALGQWSRTSNTSIGAAIEDRFAKLCGRLVQPDQARACESTRALLTNPPAA